ncbi:MAG: hypothetical protein ABSH06_14265 [Thermodesulfobacteriota bacterium]|jgi:hypothetical protein
MKVNKKNLTGTAKPNEIQDEAERMSRELAKGRDHYKGKTKTTFDPNHGVANIIDVKVDPYKGVSKKSKIEGDVDNTTNFDRKAYEDFHDE